MRIVNLDGYDIGRPVEGRPYKTPSPEQIEKRWAALQREKREQKKSEDKNA